MTGRVPSRVDLVGVRFLLKPAGTLSSGSAGREVRELPLSLGDPSTSGVVSPVDVVSLESEPPDDPEAGILAIRVSATSCVRI